MSFLCKRQRVKGKTQEREIRNAEKGRCGCQIEMRCQDANSNPPCMFEYCTISSIAQLIHYSQSYMEQINTLIMFVFPFSIFYLFNSMPLLPHPSALSMLLRAISGASFTLNSQRCWGQIRASFRHNRQSTYPPTYL